MLQELGRNVWEQGGCNLDTDLSVVHLRPRSPGETLEEVLAGGQLTPDRMAASSIVWNDNPVSPRTGVDWGKVTELAPVMQRRAQEVFVQSAREILGAEFVDDNGVVRWLDVPEERLNALMVRNDRESYSLRAAASTNQGVLYERFFGPRMVDDRGVIAWRQVGEDVLRTLSQGIVPPFLEPFRGKLQSLAVTEMSRRAADRNRTRDEVNGAEVLGSVKRALARLFRS